jgi:ComF family protein
MCAGGDTQRLVSTDAPDCLAAPSVKHIIFVYWREGVKLRTTLTRIVCHALDMLAGADCLLCGCPSGGGPVCASCVEMLPRHIVPACPRCALPTPGGVPCGRCLAIRPAFDATHAAFDYAFPLDVLVQALKYRHHLALGDFFARWLPSLAAADVVVPMPLHPRRLAERGFNQAVEIARPFARAAGVALELDGVTRVRDTPPQVNLPHGERLGNLRGAFVCRRRFDGLKVAVVDDVMTTGTSLDALARCLKASGAARVDNWVVARTVMGG